MMVPVQQCVVPVACDLTVGGSPLSKGIVCEVLPASWCRAMAIV
jgi:hypothetical protein